MQVDRRALFAALRILLPVTDPKSSSPVLSHLLLEAGSGTLTITATDGSIRLSHQVTAEGELRACLPAKLLQAMIKPEGRGDSGDVVFEIEENVCSVAVDGLTSKIASMAAEEFPVAVKGDWSLAALWPTTPFSEALSYIIPAAHHSDDRPHINCAALIADRLVATDGHRLHLAPAPSNLGEPILVPLDAAKVLCRILTAGEQVVLARTDKHIRFGIAGWQLTSKLVDCRFPPFEKVVPARDSQTTHLTVDHGLFTKALNRVSRISKNAPVRLTINGVINIATSDPDLGEAEVVVPAVENDHEGDDLVTGVAPAYLRDAVGKKGGNLEWSFGGSTDAIRLDLSGDRVAVVMPVRL